MEYRNTLRMSIWKRGLDMVVKALTWVIVLILGIAFVILLGIAAIIAIFLGLLFGTIYFLFPLKEWRAIRKYYKD